MIYAVRAILISTSGLTDLVPEENVFVSAREQVVGLPAVLVEVEDNSPNDTKTSSSTADEWQITVTCFGETYAAAWQVAEQVRMALDGFSGNVAVISPVNEDVDIRHIAYEGQTEDWFDDQQGIHYIGHRYAVWQLREGQVQTGADPVSIVDQDNNVIATVQPGGTYQVLVVSSITDTTLASVPTDTIIDDPF